MLAFGSRTAIATTAALAAMTSAAATTTPATLAAIVAFASRFATIITTLEWLAAVRTRLLVAGTPVFAAIPALAAASASTAAIAALALIALATRVGGVTRLRCRRLFGASEESLQPADEAAGLLLRLIRCRRLIRLRCAGLELPFVTAVTWLEASRLARFASALARLPGLARFVGTTFSATLTSAFTTLPPFAGRLESATLARVVS